MNNTFEIKSWDEAPYLELNNGVKYSRAKLVKEYTGQIVGVGQLEYLITYNESGSSFFTGIEHFEGTLNNLKGTFSMVHEGTFADGSVESKFRIIENSQTNELAKATGEGSYKTGHSMSVDFDFTNTSIT